MNKFFVFIIAFFALSQVSYAQDKVFAKGDKVISASLGFINTAYTGSRWENTFPPISLTGEYGIIDGLIDGKASIGVGAKLGLAGIKYTDNASHNYSLLVLGARGAFHYQFIDKLDTYAGFFLGYDIVSGQGSHAVSQFDLDWYIGARYYFTNNFAAMAEIGNKISLLSLGIAYKF
jgi:hypothetical protein